MTAAHSNFTTQAQLVREDRILANDLAAAAEENPDIEALLRDAESRIRPSIDGLQETILRMIRTERDRQDELWGDRTVPGNGRSAPEWVTILTEEVGELAEASLGFHFGSESHDEMVEESVQIAAVAMAIVESCANYAVEDG